MTAVRRVLFVDDDTDLLAGLRRTLRLPSTGWQLEFAAGGAQALDRMAERTFDAVVSDLRMPGMDGAQLLAEVGRRYPRAARVILSEDADRGSVIAAVGPAHQYLAKPCEVDVLVGTLERVLAVRDLIDDDRLADLLGGVESLPKPPRIHAEMLAVSADPRATLADVVAVIEQDLATSAEVLRLVNTAFFGLPAEVTTIARAASLLGLATIQALAVAGAVFGAGGPPPPSLDTHELAQRGMQVGRLARCLAREEGWSRQAVADAFFAGMLFDLGLPTLARANPAAWAAIRSARSARSADAASGQVPDLAADSELEVAHFGCSVTRAGAYLLGLWGFGEPVVAALALQPADPADPAGGDAAPAALVLSFARRAVCHPQAPQPVAPTGYLDRARLVRWQGAALDLLTDQ